MSSSDSVSSAQLFAALEILAEEDDALDSGTSAPSASSHAASTMAGDQFGSSTNATSELASILANMNAANTSAANNGTQGQSGVADAALSSLGSILENFLSAVGADPAANKKSTSNSSANSGANGKYNSNDPKTQEVFSLTRKISNIDNRIAQLQQNGGSPAEIARLQREKNRLELKTNFDLQDIMKTQGASAENAVEHAGNKISEKLAGEDDFNYDQSPQGFLDAELGQLAAGYGTGNDASNTQSGSYNPNDPTTKQVFALTREAAELTNMIAELEAMGDYAGAAELEQLLDAVDLKINLDLQHIMKTQGAGAENAVEHEGNKIDQSIDGQDSFNYDQSSLGFATTELAQWQGAYGSSADAG